MYSPVTRTWQGLGQPQVRPASRPCMSDTATPRPRRARQEPRIALQVVVLHTPPAPTRAPAAGTAAPPGDKMISINVAPSGSSVISASIISLLWRLQLTARTINPLKTALLLYSLTNSVV